MGQGRRERDTPPKAMVVREGWRRRTVEGWSLARQPLLGVEPGGAVGETPGWFGWGQIFVWMSYSWTLGHHGRSDLEKAFSRMQ